MIIASVELSVKALIWKVQDDLGGNTPGTAEAEERQRQESVRSIVVVTEPESHIGHPVVSDPLHAAEEEEAIPQDINIDPSKPPLESTSIASEEAPVQAQGTGDVEAEAESRSSFSTRVVMEKPVAAEATFSSSLAGSEDHELQSEGSPSEASKEPPMTGSTSVVDSATNLTADSVASPPAAPAFKRSALSKKFSTFTQCEIEKFQENFYYLRIQERLEKARQDGMTEEQVAGIRANVEVEVSE